MIIEKGKVKIESMPININDGMKVWKVEYIK